MDEYLNQKVEQLNIDNMDLINGVEMEEEDNDFDNEYSNYFRNRVIENFVSKNVVNNEKKNNDKHIGILPIRPNKLYYGAICKYIKDDAFYTALKELDFMETKDIKNACLIVPCSYENTENEINELKMDNIENNIYGNAIRIFMLSNTDYMVSKISLWKFLRERYGKDISSTMIPYSVDLKNSKELEEFKKNYDNKKIYITKNNNQRQEGLEIHTTLESIVKSIDKYILVQELLQDPYLINGRKINLRVYCLLIVDSNSNIKVQVYQDGFMYYTPELFEKGNPSFKKNITTGYIDRKVYIENPLTHADFSKYLDSDRTLTPVEQYYKKTRPNTKLSTYIFTQINHLLKFIFETYVGKVGTDTPGVGFQLYGTDIAINEHLKPMIMEINKGPDLSFKDGRDARLKIDMCKDILKSVDLIPNIDNKFLTVLEIVKMNNEFVEFDNYSS